MVVTLVIDVIGNIGSWRGKLVSEFPPLLNIPTDFNIDRMLKTYVI
jgi:hypothetical protein